MSYVEQDIPAAFFAQLATMASPPPISYENIDFTPPSQAPWIECFWLPAKTYPAEIGDIGGNMQTGLFQITIHVPNNTGIGSALAIVGTLIQLFKRGTVLTHGVVAGLNITTCSVGKGMAGDQWYSIPVSISYWGITPN